MITNASGPLPRIDVHVHLAGVGTQDSGCWTSPGFRRRPAFLGLRLLFGIGRGDLDHAIDQEWAAFTSALVRESELDFAVALGFDGVYDSDGKLDAGKSQMIVPPSWVFESCERFGNLLPGPSINPYRRDALDRLEEAIERGAVLIKWLPIVQGFDPAGKRAAPFLRRVAESGIPLLVHSGSGEVTFRTVHAAVGGLERLIPALEAGITVICAHSGAPIHHSIDRGQLSLLRSLLGSFSNLWVDNSGLTNPSRCLHLPRLIADPVFHDRTIHGSDFPIPPSPIYYCHRLGLARTLDILRTANPLQREIEIKRNLGVSDASFHRAATILANLDRWRAPAQADPASTSSLIAGSSERRNASD